MTTTDSSRGYNDYNKNLLLLLLPIRLPKRRREDDRASSPTLLPLLFPIIIKKSLSG